MVITTYLKSIPNRMDFFCFEKDISTLVELKYLLYVCRTTIKR